MRNGQVEIHDIPNKMSNGNLKEAESEASKEAHLNGEINLAYDYNESPENDNHTISSVEEDQLNRRNNAKKVTQT